MKIDFSRPLLQFNGQPMNVRQDESGRPIPATLGEIVVEALASPKLVDGQPQPMQGQDHVRIFALAQRIFNADTPIDITAAEIVEIQTRLAEHFVQPLVVGQALTMLEN